MIVSGKRSNDFYDGEILAEPEFFGKPISEKRLITALGRAVNDSAESMAEEIPS